MIEARGRMETAASWRDDVGAYVDFLHRGIDNLRRRVELIAPWEISHEERGRLLRMAEAAKRCTDPGELRRVRATLHGHVAITDRSM